MHEGGQIVSGLQLPCDLLCDTLPFDAVGAVLVHADEVVQPLVYRLGVATTYWEPPHDIRLSLSFAKPSTNNAYANT